MMQIKTFLSVLTIVFFWLLPTGVSCAQDLALDSWRSPRNGGLNVLYCYLRINGIECRYEDLLRDRIAQGEKNAETILMLADLAAQKGLPLQAVSLNMDQLLACPKPVLVHIDGDSPDTGAFALVVNVTNEKVFFVNGPTASIDESLCADFRRVWSGFALIPKAPPRQDVRFYSVGFIAGLLLIVIIKFTQLKQML